MIRISTLIIVLFCVSMTTTSTAQNLLQVADKQFELKAFDQAKDNYLQLLTEKPNDRPLILKIADCYRLTNQDTKAATYYEKATNLKELKGTNCLNYGNVLKRLGRYEKANIQFQKYVVVNPVEANNYITSCDFAKALSEEVPAIVSNLPFNSPNSEFGASVAGENLVFASFSNDIDNQSFIQGLQSLENGSKLFVTDAVTPTSIDLCTSLAEKRNIAPISYDPDSGNCVYSTNYMENGSLHVFDDDRRQAIFTAIISEGGDFSKEKPFEHNVFGYSSAYPCLAKGGKTLYFASNRPGGLGGYDLYSCTLKDGKWSLPKNLGDKINTSGNEITPSIIGDKLYFASDFHLGMGGFDIFSSVAGDEYSEPMNLGNGINSSRDDYFPAGNTDRGILYFTSNRGGGMGNDDIYMTDLQLDITLPQLVETKVEEDEVSDAFLVSDKNNDRKSDLLVAPPAYVLPDLTKGSKEDPTVKAVNYERARRLTLGEVLPVGKVYFVQLAAFSNPNANLEKFRGLVKYGNIYKHYQYSVTKIRLGYYMDEKEAREVLRSVKAQGYRDAFVTLEKLNASELELVMANRDFSSQKHSGSTNDDDSYQVPRKFNGNSKYKVKLASYEDPIWFDIEKARDLGQIEQWTKGGWTIFILGGYEDMEDADKAMIKAVNRGFKDAEIVIDDDGILKKLKEN